jgi:hypothetical protein
MQQGDEQRALRAFLGARNQSERFLGFG